LDPLVRGMDPRIRIRTKMSRIPNTDLLPWFRIKMSMLLDLDKDYLKDMDITLMGDIINILKHARVVANRNTSEMVLSDKVPVTYKNATKY
jgi:hypothetical protein